MEEIWNEFAQRCAGRMEAFLVARMTRFFERTFRSELNLVYSETEAAAFLKVSKETLQAWRKRKLIEYAQYPIGRIRDEKDENKLSEIYTYDLAGMLSFRVRYLNKTLDHNAFEFDRKLTLVGPAVKDVRAA